MELITFKRWSRSPWGIFSSLGKNIRIGVLCVSLSILVLPGKSQQSVDSVLNSKNDKEIELDEVVVSAQRTPVLQSELMRVVQVITRSEIEQAAATDLSGLLEYIQGVDIRQRGGSAQADISIRGGTFDQTMILLNGVNISDPQTGHHNLNLPVDLNSIERIEVLKGPGARIFGPNAFNGAINIIAGETKNKKFSGVITGGQYASGDISVAASAPIGKTQQHFSVNGSTSDGYISNTDYKAANLFYRVQLPGKSFDYDLQAGYLSKDFGANSFYTPRFPDQFEAIKSKFVSLKIKNNNKPKLTAQTYWRRHHDRFELFRNEAPAWYSGHNYHMTDIAGGSVNWAQTWNSSRINAGIEYRYEHIYSNVLGDSLDALIRVPGENGHYFSKSYARNGLSFMSEYSFWNGPFTLSAGFLIYVNPSLPEGISLYPGLDVGYKVTQNLRLFANANRTLRLPTFTDLFYNSATNTGNAELKPEEAITIETGLHYEWTAMKFDAAVFKRYGRNLIDWVRYSTDEKWQSMNLTKVDITGIETGIGYTSVVENSMINSCNIDYTYIFSSKESSGYASLYVLDNIRHKLDFSLNHRLTRNSGADWKLSVQKRNGGYQPYTGDKFENEIPYGTVVLADMRTWYVLNKMTIFISVTNLFNTKVVDHANVSQPGLWMKMGIKWNFKQSS
ncbi:MAG TPA: TonB-dependent receptor [Lentimicrobium sp.]|nr:TonB-dependent receptor [Lentimicrobium sp.]